MEQNEQYGKRVLSAVGWSLVILWGLMQAFGVFITILSLILAFLPIPAVTSDVIYELSYAAGYLATFMLPVLFLRLILRRGGCAVRPMECSASISPQLPFLVFASVALCFSAAQINALLLEVIDYSSFTSEVLLPGDGPMAPYAAVLYFIVISVVPAFCEEFLFRGAILENLLPFGRSNAILLSAFFFALMHQNAGQLLYTFVAGIALGLIYVHTKSIWNCTVVHLLNNFISVLQELIYERLGDTVIGNATLLVMESVIYVLGVISLCVLILRFFSQHADIGNGVFQKALPPSDAFAQETVPKGREWRFFFRPSVIVFCVLCLFQIVLLVLMAILGGVLL